MSVADMGQLYNDSEADTRYTAHRHVYCLFFHNGAVRSLTTDRCTYWGTGACRNPTTQCRYCYESGHNRNVNELQCSVLGRSVMIKLQ